MYQGRRSIILQQFTLYTRRRVVTSMDKEMGEQAFDTLFTLKTVLSSVEAMSQDVTSVKQQVISLQQGSRRGSPLQLTPHTNFDETNFSRTSSGVFVGMPAIPSVEGTPAQRLMKRCAVELNCLRRAERKMPCLGIFR